MPARPQWLIRLPQVQASEQGTSLEQGSQQIVQIAAEGRTAQL